MTSTTEEPTGAEAQRVAELQAELTRRNAELAVINEIGEALARQLDFQAIIDAVGERIRAIFDVETGIIGLYDSTSDILSLPYAIDEGQRIEEEPRQLSGLAEQVIRGKRPLRLGTGQDAIDLGAYVFGSGALGELWLGVPILAGDRVLGAISLERMPKNAFSEF